MKIKKKSVFRVRGLELGGPVGGGGGGGQGGCERRIDVFVKIQKKIGGGGVGGRVGVLGRRDRADVNEELKLLWKCKTTQGRNDLSPSKQNPSMSCSCKQS